MLQLRVVEGTVDGDSVVAVRRARCVGLVQPGPGVRVGRVLCQVRRARLQETSVLSTRTVEQRRARSRRRPVIDALQLRILRFTRSWTQACRFFSSLQLNYLSRVTKTHICLTDVAAPVKQICDFNKYYITLELFRVA